MELVKKIRSKIKKFIKKFDVTDLMIGIGAVLIFKALFNINTNLGLISLGLTSILLALLVHKVKISKAEENIFREDIFN